MVTGSGGSGSGGTRTGGMQSSGAGGGTGTGGTETGGMQSSGTGGAGTGTGGTGTGGTQGSGTGEAGTGSGGSAGSGGSPADGGTSAACNSLDVALTASTCTVIPTTPTPVGGTIPSGVYRERQQSSVWRCASTIASAMRLTAAADGSFMGENHQIANGTESRTNFTMTVSGTTVHQTFTCGYNASQSWSYSLLDNDGAIELDFISSGSFLYIYDRTGD
jgi:hypothetical protein